MKVLHVYKTYLPDSFHGTEHVIWEIAEGTRHFGIDATVLSLSDNPVPRRSRVGHHTSVRVRENVSIGSSSFSLPLFSAFREEAAAADLVHYHFPWPMMDLLHLLRTPDRPSIVTYHSDIVRQRALNLAYTPVMDMFLRRVARIVATSPNYIESSSVLPRFRDKLEVIPIGLSDPPEPDPPLLQQWRQRLGQSFFLFVGAFRYYKGLQVLMQAARMNGLPVVLVGCGEMDSAVHDDMPANVTCLGHVSEADKLALLAACTAFVFPSQLRSEAFGVALLEAARSGKPMISCELGTGTSFVNIDGQTGRVVAPNDAAALACAMSELWADPAQAERWGKAARIHYKALFTANDMAAAYNRLYRRLASEERRHLRSGPGRLR